VKKNYVNRRCAVAVTPDRLNVIAGFHAQGQFPKQLGANFS